MANRLTSSLEAALKCSSSLRHKRGLIESDGSVRKSDLQQSVSKHQDYVTVLACCADEETCIIKPRHFTCFHVIPYFFPSSHVLVSFSLGRTNAKSRLHYSTCCGKACRMPTPCPFLQAIRPRRILASHSRCLHSLRGSAPIRPLQLSKQLYRAQNRGKKTKASIKLDDLPQGVIPLDPLPLEQDAPPTYSTVVQQARTNMRKFENCVLLTRVGGFYELYFEHAEEFASLLNLKEARRPTRPGAPVVPMVCYPASVTRTWC